MNDNKNFKWNFTLTYNLPSNYAVVFRSNDQVEVTIDSVEDQLAAMTEYADAMAVINKAKK